MKLIAVLMYFVGVLAMVYGAMEWWANKSEAYAFGACLFSACAAIGAWRHG